MKKLFVVLAACAIALTGLAAQDLDVALQRAIQKETVSGDLKAAIAEYDAIVKRAGANKAVAAQALIRMGDALRKLGESQAKTVYERVLRDYADQPQAAAHARAALQSLGPARVTNAGRSSRSVWSGADALGSPSADGRFFSHTDWETGDLAIRDLVSGTSRRVTNKGSFKESADFAEFSAIAPDGRFVAYAWYVEKPAEHYELRLAATSEEAVGNPRVLDTGYWIQPGGWSADGRHLVYMRHPHETRDEIMLVSLPDGKPRVLSSGRSFERPTISPDGKHVAYAAPAGPDNPERDIFVLAVDGGTPVAIAHRASDWQPFFTPDGSRLLFISNRSGRPSLWSLPMRAGRPAGPAELVERDVSLVMGITRDRAIYYFRSGERTNVFVASVEEPGAEPQLLSELYLNEANSPAWAPDGRALAHYATVNPGARVAPKAIVIRSEKSGSAATIVPQLRIAPGVAAGLQWFADGRSLLVVTRAENTFGFHRVDATNGTTERLMETAASAQGANGPQVSPDGRTLFYVRPNPPTNPPSPARTIVRRDLVTGTEVELKSGWFSAIALSRDGRQLAYLGNDSSGAIPKQVIAVLPADGGTPRVLFEGEWKTNRSNVITWDPEGRFVYFVKQESGVATLWRVPAAGGVPAKTTVSFKGSMVGPAIHPDGKRVAFTGSERNPPEMWLLENYLPPANGRNK